MRRYVRLFLISLIIGFMMSIGTLEAFGHPLDTPGVSIDSVAGASQGHTHGLECAARESPVLGELGLPCSAD